MFSDVYSTNSAAVFKKLDFSLDLFRSYFTQQMALWF